MDADVLSELAKRGADVEALAERLAAHPAEIGAVFEGLRSEKASVKYGCGKLLRLLSSKAPAALAPRIGELLELAESDNKFLRWGAILTVGNLAGVDSEGLIESRLGRFLSPIRGPVMVTAASTIKAAEGIAKARPGFAARIAREILGVESASYETAECRNVAIGAALETLEAMLPLLLDREPVFGFARRQLKNTRNSTRKRAERLVKKSGFAPGPGRAKAGGQAPARARKDVPVSRPPARNRKKGKSRS